MVSKSQFNAPKCDYTFNDDGSITSLGDIRGKVSGTMMAGIMGLSPWSTPFQVACNLLGLATVDISNKPAVKAGHALESSIIEYMGESHPDIGAFVPAEDMFENREGEHSEWEPDFIDDIFTGHVDGIVMAEDGNQYILEIKTSSNMDSWTQGVPTYYYWQVALYNHFITKQDKAYVGLGVMNPEALKDPSTWTPGDTNTALFEMPIDQNGVDTVLGVVAEWYKDYILKGKTPPYDPENPGDVEMYNHLKNLTNDESCMQDMIDELAEVREVIDEGEAKLADFYAREEELKAKLKEYLIGHEIEMMDSTSGGWHAVISQTVRRKVDATKLKEAGIDPEPFTTTSISKTFTIKKTKKD